MDYQNNRSPFLTDDLPGTGGNIRERNEDFQVEEIPLYTPSGEGTHLYLWVEKEGVSTMEAVAVLARALNRRVEEFGVAGLKDAAAVTRQYLSIEHQSQDAVRDLDLQKIKVLEMALHGNKLKMGHLKGNRFKILIRNPVPGAVDRAQPIFDRLARMGVPNYYGPQRFGIFYNTHLLGLKLILKDYEGFADVLVGSKHHEEGGAYEKVIHHYLRGDYQEALVHLGRRYKYEGKVLRSLVRHPGRFDRAVTRIEKRMLKFYFSAFQSFLFNRYLEKRLHRLEQLECGEIAYIHGKGASFRVEDPSGEADRLVNFEISPSGPLFGSKMLRAEGEPGILEDALLQEAGLERASLKGAFGIRLRGARRPLRVPITEWALKQVDSGLEVLFRLPQGSYATVVLRELTKDNLY